MILGSLSLRVFVFFAKISFKRSSSDGETFGFILRRRFGNVTGSVLAEAIFTFFVIFSFFMIFLLLLSLF
ncbi:unnamed protein product [Meloidogyne enterolobii]|uniref:Uncharacterized protein n=1 Tax=Meloidogyne enterolobii TaxID=390850 RepID=A0ACB1B5E2_MELEN